jgi:glycerate kinase
VHVVVATDKFRGTATAAEVGGAVAAAVEATGGTCDVVQVADGGEGFLDAVGGANRTTLVTGPLGDPVEAAWRISGGQAVVEMAQASGLALLADGDNDPVAASTYGTGELIGAAIDAGAKRVLVGVGGSATTDGGFGALRALYPLQRLRGIDIRVACDVRTKFVDAAEVFASSGSPRCTARTTAWTCLTSKELALRADSLEAWWRLGRGLNPGLTSSLRKWTWWENSRDLTLW